MLSPATAVADAVVPLPSVLDFTDGQNGPAIALGGGLDIGSAYAGADEIAFTVEPVIALHYRLGDHLLFWENLSLGWRSALTRRLFVQAGLAYEDGLDPDDSDDGQLNGIAKRDAEATAFAEMRYSDDGSWRTWVGARIMGGEAEYGVSGELSAGQAFGTSDGLGLEGSIYTSFGNDAFVNRDFGINASEAVSSGLAETVLPGGFTAFGIEMIYRMALAKNLQLIAEGGMTFYSSGIKRSPITRQDYEAEIGLAAVYLF